MKYRIQQIISFTISIKLSKKHPCTPCALPDGLKNLGLNCMSSKNKECWYGQFNIVGTEYNEIAQFDISAANDHF